MHAARLKAKLTQVQVSKTLGIGQTTVVDAERTAQGVPWVVAAAKLYGVSVEWLSLGVGSIDDTFQSSGAKPWPFEEVARDRIEQLTPVQRGIIEGEMLRALERIETAAASRKRQANGE